MLEIDRNIAKDKLFDYNGCNDDHCCNNVQDRDHDDIDQWWWDDNEIDDDDVDDADLCWW